jgi:hypothetical protein
MPHLFGGYGIDPDRVVVERVEEDFAVGVRGSAIDGVAARDPLRRSKRLRFVNPLRRGTRLGENVHAGSSDPTLSAVVAFRPLNRVFA